MIYDTNRADKNYFPVQIRGNSSFDKHVLKEYLQLMILDYLSSTPTIQKMVFIGGTNLRLVKGIDRFSEDLDFDCKDLSKEEFVEMTNGVIRFWSVQA
ncbi:MAG: nucleotidyl transferase AbiEii/AbiGii toxin family protein [Butyricimonas faecalis]